MNVPLSEHWQRFVREEVQSGRFSSEAAVLEEAASRCSSSGSSNKARRNLRTGPAPSRSAREIIDELMSDVPDDVLDRLPVDGAAQHDHYLYGTPRRPI